MHLSPSMIPSVKVGAGVPFQSTSAMPQAVVQTPVQSGSLMGVPPDTLVPVQLGNMFVHVPSQPVQTQTVHMLI